MKEETLVVLLAIEQLEYLQDRTRIVYYEDSKL